MKTFKKETSNWNTKRRHSNETLARDIKQGDI